MPTNPTLPTIFLLLFTGCEARLHTELRDAQTREAKAQSELNEALQGLAFAAGVEMESHCMLQIQRGYQPAQIEVCQVIHTKSYKEKMAYWKEHYDK